MSEDIRYPSIVQVPFNGRMVTLGSPSSQMFNLSGDGSSAGITIAWEPEGREAMEVEVRARIMSNSGGADDFPEVRWMTETSGGNAVWKEPFETPPGTVENVRGFGVPARGMVWRNGARQFRITFFAAGTAAGANLGEAVLQVSILPVWAGLVDTYPYAESKAVQSNTTVAPFPMTAREWRVQNLSGLPVPFGGATIAFAGINGAAFIGGDASLYADWQPIPFQAAAWGTGAPGVYAAYR